VPRATLKNNAPKSCNVARPLLIKANSQYLFCAITKLQNTSFYLFYDQMSSMTQQHRICIDPPNIAVQSKNQSKCMVQHSLHHVLRTWITWCHVPQEHDAAIMKLGNTVYFCTSRDIHWTNHDLIIQIMIEQLLMFSSCNNTYHCMFFI